MRNEESATRQCKMRLALRSLVDIPVVGWPGDGSVGGWRSGNATELGDVGEGPGKSYLFLLTSC